ncbi:MAG: OmpA family protein [Phycisphaerae bacterium]
MNRVRSLGWLAAAVWAVVAAAGCVSLEKHKQVQFALRKSQEKNEQLARDLQDERTRAATLEKQLSSKDNELGVQKSLTANLQQENERLRSSYDRLQEEFQTLVKKLGMPKPIGVERVLPAELDKALKDFAAAHPEVVQYEPKRGVVKWKSDLLFALGSDVVKQSAAEALRSFAQIVNSPAGTGFDVIIVGHTDNVPIVKPQTKAKHPTNWHLSVHRAISVMNQLRRAGVKVERMGVMGYGEYRPIASNATKEGRQKNRRVEIFLVPSGSVGPVSENLWQPGQSDVVFAWAR